MTIQYLHSNGSHAWSPSPVGDTEGFVQVGVHYISAIICWSTKSNLMGGKNSNSSKSLRNGHTSDPNCLILRCPAQRGNEVNDLSTERTNSPSFLQMCKIIRITMTKMTTMINK